MNDEVKKKDTFVELPETLLAVSDEPWDAPMAYCIPDSPSAVRDYIDNLPEDLTEEPMVHKEIPVKAPPPERTAPRKKRVFIRQPSGVEPARRLRTKQGATMLSHLEKKLRGMLIK